MKFAGERELRALRDEGVLAAWGPAGRAVRPGGWVEQARPTPDLIEAAIAEGRMDDAAELGRHLVVEAQEIHDLYSDWSAAIPRILERRGVAASRLADAARGLQELAPADPAGDWEAFLAAVEAFADGCAREDAAHDADHGAALEHAVETWRTAHDRHRDLVAGWIDVFVVELGEDELGDLWRELQADGIASYRRYDLAATPWPESFPFVVQTAIEGMHGHLGGPAGRGEVEVREHDDRVELSFAPCGSGGRIRAAERFGVTEEPHDWAWNERGVCRYCVHCCVLMQLEPIDRLGFPVRVIDPPLRPGDPCTWTTYRDPEAVPESAYRRVGRERPQR